MNRRQVLQTATVMVTALALAALAVVPASALGANPGTATTTAFSWIGNALVNTITSGATIHSIHCWFADNATVTNSSDTNAIAPYAAKAEKMTQ